MGIRSDLAGWCTAGLWMLFDPSRRTLFGKEVSCATEWDLE